MEIADWREKIDALDRQLVELLNERCRCAVAIGRLKRRQALPIYEPAREKIILENIRRHNRGPLSDRALRDIFERLIDEMRAAQKYEALGEANPIAGAAGPAGDDGALESEKR